MTEYDPLPSPPGLTIGGCIGASLTVVWDNRVILFKAIILPAVVLGALSGLFPYDPDGAAGLPASSNTVGAAAGAVLHTTVLPSLTQILAVLASMVLITSFSVSWIRYLVLGETPSAVYFARPFWSYLGNGLLLGLATTGIAVLCAFIVIMAGIVLTVGVHAADSAHWKPDAGTTVLLVLATLVGIIPAVWWGLRRILIYPASALGNVEMRWETSSLAMRGHVFRYLVAGFVVGLPFSIASTIPEAMAEALVKHGLAPAILIPTNIFAQICAFASAAAGASMLTLFYIALIQRRDISRFMRPL